MYLYQLARPSRVPDRSGDTLSMSGEAKTPVDGHHALFVARVQHWPFKTLAEVTWANWKREAEFQLLDRQSRFLAALHPGIQAMDDNTDSVVTVELRYIHRAGSKEIECVLLGKAFNRDQEAAQASAKQLWETISALMPLGYSLAPAQTPVEFSTWAGFNLFRQFEEKGQIAEIRRPAEFLLWTDPKVPLKHLPIIYPYQWQDAGWEAMWLTMSRIETPTMISVSLRPDRLYPVEELSVAEILAYLHEVGNTARPPLSTRAQEAAHYFDDWHAIHPLYSVRVQVFGPPALQLVVRSSLTGLEIAKEAEPLSGTVLADVVRPTADDLPIARNNFSFLEQDAWGPTTMPAPFDRLRYLSDVSGAVCAFRLPMLPSNTLSGLSIGTEVEAE